MRSAILLIAFITAGCQSDKMRIGNARGSLWQWVDAPKHVVEHASSVLCAPTESWTIDHTIDFGEKRLVAEPFDVVCIRAKHGKTYICTVVHGQWTWLGGTQELKHLSALYQPTLQKLASKADKPATQEFCRHVAYLHRGPYRHLLSRDFKQDPHLDGWLYGTKSSVSDLFRYSIDPQATIRGKYREVVFWVIVGDGTVERWAIRMREQNGGVEMTSISVQEVEPRGTFNCPICL